jgi:DNA mismatch repair protein MutS
MNAENKNGPTPMMRHYLEVKAQYPDHIVFYRMGDFYEMFGDDAKTVAPVLGITLTSRSHGSSGRTALAGVPHHAAPRYLSKLLQAGFKVAVCEQTEDPKKAKGLVRREVTEVLTPGADLTEGVFESASASRLGAMAFGRGDTVGLALLDLSTGEFETSEMPLADALSSVEVEGVRELVVPEGAALPDAVVSLFDTGVVRTEQPAFRFAPREADRALREHFGVATLEGFGVGGMRLGTGAAGAALAYVVALRRGVVKHITRLAPARASGRMQLDAATVRNLELIAPLSPGDERATLFSSVNRTLTRGGARLLRSDIASPSTDEDVIRARQSAVADLVADDASRAELREALSGCPDLMRLSAKLGLGKATPRDLVAVADGCRALPETLSVVRGLDNPHLSRRALDAPDLSALADTISSALADDPPAAHTASGVFRDGYDERLDEIRTSARDGRAAIAGLQERERERTGIGSLKVGYNQVFGYYIEVSKPNLSRVPEGEYIRRQTLVNAERFVTEELKRWETQVLGADERISALEAELFVKLRERIADRLSDLQVAARVLSEVDVVASLAEVARERGYARPELTDENVVVITDGRHPALERIISDFVPNDTSLGLDGDRLHVITGPNMAGKSTYLRQVGLIVILAQIGSFVPAADARIGLVDRVFTRVGAQDRIAAGRSTFLVEMEETALILHSATDRSLVLLDEVGRGTSTYDGLSIAWAVGEHFATTLRSRTLFATHFHELTELATVCAGIRSFRIQVREVGDNVVFLRRIVPGGCDDSYGIHVARLAGVPTPVVERAREVLSGLEGEPVSSRLPRPIDSESALVAGMQVDMFAPAEDPLLAELREVDSDGLTPREAHAILSALVERAKSK